MSGFDLLSVWVGVVYCEWVWSAVSMGGSDLLSEWVWSAVSMGGSDLLSVWVW